MKLTLDVKLTPRELATAFCDMDDEAQAQFFIDCADIMQGWHAANREMQAMYIGRHLRDCACSTDAARDLVRNIADAAGKDGA